MRIPSDWQPLPIQKLQEHLGNFTDWTLCGGCSVDLLLGRHTRTHGDIDIGVFRSQLIECLHAIGAERVFLCSAPDTRVQWDGTTVDAAVHDIWISDHQREHWVMQIVVFDDEGEDVIYRRDRRIRWPKGSHHVNCGSVRVLNPLITFLFKANKSELEEKDVLDIVALISAECD